MQPKIHFANMAYHASNNLMRDTPYHFEKVCAKILDSKRERQYWESWERLTLITKLFMLIIVERPMREIKLAYYHILREVLIING